jgi:hypothetical protein
VPAVAAEHGRLLANLREWQPDRAFPCDPKAVAAGEATFMLLFSRSEFHLVMFVVALLVGEGLAGLGTVGTRNGLCRVITSSPHHPTSSPRLILHFHSTRSCRAVDGASVQVAAGGAGVAARAAGRRAAARSAGAGLATGVTVILAASYSDDSKISMYFQVISYGMTVNGSRRQCRMTVSTLVQAGGGLLPRGSAAALGRPQRGGGGLPRWLGGDQGW